MNSYVFMLFSLVLIFWLTGCEVEMTKDEFLAKIRQHSTETINHVHYIGSEREYDYFCHTTTLSEKFIRIKKGDFSLETRFPLTRNKKEWMLIKRDWDIILQNIK